MVHLPELESESELEPDEVSTSWSWSIMFLRTFFKCSLKSSLKKFNNTGKFYQL